MGQRQIRAGYASLNELEEALAGPKGNPCLKEDMLDSEGRYIPLCKRIVKKDEVTLADPNLL